MQETELEECEDDIQAVAGPPVVIGLFQSAGETGGAGGAGPSPLSTLESWSNKSRQGQEVLFSAWWLSRQPQLNLQLLNLNG